LHRLPRLPIPPVGPIRRHLRRTLKSHRAGDGTPRDAALRKLKEGWRGLVDIFDPGRCGPIISTTMDLTAPQQYAAGYGRAAQDYLRVLDPTLSSVHRRIVELARVGAGTRLLDLATGTGAVARVAAANGATVTGVDVAPAMVELARRNSPSELQFQVADAAALPFESHTFDAITCGFGLSHMPHVNEVLAEVRRVLNPGGVFVESSWGAEGESPAFSAVLLALKRHSKGDLHSFAGILDEDTWADPDSGVKVIRSAGFHTVDVLTERCEGTFAGPGHVLAWALAWPDYGETAAALGDAAGAFRAEAVVAAGQADLRWWFGINYFVATAPG